MSILSVEKVTMRFGGLTAVKDLSLDVQEGQIFSIIGPNGAGKTTAFNVITGIYHPTEGEIRFHGHVRRRPFRYRNLITFLLIGLLTSIIGFVAIVHIDQLWKASVKDQDQENFSYSIAIDQAGGYINGGLNIEPNSRRDRWNLLPPNEEDPLVRLKTEEEARNARTAIHTGKLKLEEKKGVSFGGLRVEPNSRGDRWRVLPPNEEGALFQAKTQAPAMKAREVIFAGKFTVKEDKDEVVVTNPEGDLELFSGDRADYKEWKDTIDSIVNARERVTLTVSTEDGLELFTGSKESYDEWNARVEAVRAKRAARQGNLGLSMLIGFAVGPIAAFVVWNRSRRTTDYIALGGVARTFQNIRLFQNMTVLENVLVGMDRSQSGNILTMALRTPGLRRREHVAEERAMELLHFVGLKGDPNILAKNLPYGDQRRLEIARALACEPKLLLLDEPAAGMNPSETHDLMGLIRKIRDRGMTVLLIEHHMSLVMGISDRIAVLDYGSKIAEGTPHEIKNNPRVIEAYLGKEEVS